MYEVVFSKTGRARFRNRAGKTVTTDAAFARMNKILNFQALNIAKMSGVPLTLNKQTARRVKKQQIKLSKELVEAALKLDCKETQSLLRAGARPEPMLLTLVAYTIPTDQTCEGLAKQKDSAFFDKRHPDGRADVRNLKLQYDEKNAVQAKLNVMKLLMLYGADHEETHVVANGTTYNILDVSIGMADNDVLEMFGGDLELKPRVMWSYADIGYLLDPSKPKDPNAIKLTQDWLDFVVHKQVEYVMDDAEMEHEHYQHLYG